MTFEAAIRPLVDGYCTGPPLDRVPRAWKDPHSHVTPRRVPCRGFSSPGWRSLSTLGSANAYFAARENAVPTVLFGLLIPLMTAAVGLRLSGSFASLRLRDTATLDRGGPSLSHRRWHFPRPLGGRTPALAIRAAGGYW